MPKKSQKENVLKCLNSHCLLSGTSLKESGQTFSVKKERDETVRFFQLDKGGSKGPGRTCLGIKPDERICDLLVVIPVKKSSAYIFVELKAGNPGHAVDQIRNTIKAAQQKTRCKSRQVFGLIACRRSSPNSIRNERKKNSDIKIVSRKVKKGISTVELMQFFE